MTDLYRLVYTSRNLLDGDAAEQERVVARIVEASRRDNGRAGITGALLFGAGSFGQVLEGPRAAVEVTFERIQRDPRHRDINVLQCDPVAERIFNGWSMAFVGRSARGRALWDGFARTTGFDLGRLEGDGLCAALLAMVRAEDATAASAPGLDVERLRSALDAERPDLRVAPVAADSRSARPVPLPAPAPKPIVATETGAGSDGEERVLRAALHEERDRTTALRRALDEARIALERAKDDIEGLGRHRDIWADRSSQLRTGLKEARDRLRAAEGERDALRARLACHDGDIDALRAQRDIWADRAKALAAVLCRDPVVELDEPVPAGAGRPAGERRRQPLVNVAG